MKPVIYIEGANNSRCTFYEFPHVFIVALNSCLLRSYKKKPTLFPRLAISASELQIKCSLILDS